MKKADLNEHRELVSPYVSNQYEILTEMERNMYK